MPRPTHAHPQDALAYGRPYRDDPAASAAVYSTMESMRPWNELIGKVRDWGGDWGDAETFYKGPVAGLLL